MTRRKRAVRWRLERGSALVEFVSLGVLFILPLVWLMLVVFEIQKGMYGVTAAAREAGRAFVLAPNEGAAAARAREAAMVSLEDQGITEADLATSENKTGNPWFSYDCENGCLQSDSYVRTTITFQVSISFMPEVLGKLDPTYPTKAIQRTPYGKYQQAR